MNKYNNMTVFKYIGFLIISLLMISADQITKYFAVIKLKDRSPFVLVKDILIFRYLENPGAAWGILSGKRIIFTVLTIAVILFMLLLIIKIQKDFSYLENKKAVTALQWVLVVLLSGATGNLVDRIRLGYVIDFIYFKPIDFPTFNVADCFVTISTIILLFLLLVGIKEHDWNIILSFKKNRR